MDKDLETQYDNIMKESGGATGAAATARAEYGGEGDEADQVDPRDPTTFSKEETQTKEDEPTEETVEEPEKEGESVKAEAEGEYEDIPERLVAAGRRRGYSDEKIVGLAETWPEVLDTLANADDEVQQTRTQTRAQEPVSEPEPEVIEEIEPIKVADLGELEVGPKAEQLIKQLVASHNVLADRLNQQSTRMSQVDSVATSLKSQRQADFDTNIDVYFDKIEDLPAVGKNETLMPEQLKARKTIYGMAAVLRTADGGTLQSALGKAIKAYKGMYTDAAVNALRSKVNKTKKRFTARPGGQKTKPKFKSEEEKALAAIDEKFREFGLG